ncbi:hypothetical protein PPYR_03591 [Photinus pyralis]|uniref:chitinase n=1 Tax=Photinus pyralis TaxID=7054 RepID=A0A5N4A3B0_PHOPY|nr:acidic mammalian chitinase-like [Photinus pyralis]XP_031331230.1 acidic mammalian chitinase-like [Photinus pyralis]KAB0791791.1 hypothetical protein PPYR_03591 [Photinus pyralis]
MTFDVGVSNGSSGVQVICYYGSWRSYTTCKIEEINATLCTILIYAFAQIHENGTLKPLDEWADIRLDGYRRFTALKKRNPRLKTMLGVGGGSEGSEKYSKMVATSASRAVFIESVIGYMQKYGFDGVDLDWEYPTRRGGRLEDRENLSELLKEMRIEFDRHNYLMTMSVVPNDASIDTFYEVPQLSKYLDHILMMMYNMHSPTSGRTGHNAPLQSSNRYNVEYSTKAWVRKGGTPAKLILGIPAYGRSFTLADPGSHGIGAPSVGLGLPGPYSRANGTLYHYEVLHFQKALGWTREWSEEQQVPYSYYRDQWVGYDDAESVRRKVEFARKLNLGGVMMWTIDQDDPRGLTGEKFPLLNVINNEYAN